MYKLLFVIFYMFLSFQVFGQDNKNKNKFHNREVIIQHGEKLINVNILTGDTDDQFSFEKEYFWYKNGMIHSNIGGNGGKLLHGSYVAFIDNNLVESGQFTRGLKSGLWKSWFTSGKLESICNWKGGEFHGICLYYKEDGTIKQKLRFRNGKAKIGFMKIKRKSEEEGKEITPNAREKRKSVKDSKESQSLVAKESNILLGKSAADQKNRISKRLIKKKQKDEI